MRGERRQSGGQRRRRRGYGQQEPQSRGCDRHGYAGILRPRTLAGDKEEVDETSAFAPSYGRTAAQTRHGGVACSDEPEKHSRNAQLRCGALRVLRQGHGRGTRRKIPRQEQRVSDLSHSVRARRRSGRQNRQRTRSRDYGSYGREHTERQPRKDYPLELRDGRTRHGYHIRVGHHRVCHGTQRERHVGLRIGVRQNRQHLADNSRNRLSLLRSRRQTRQRLARAHAGVRRRGLLHSGQGHGTFGVRAARRGRSGSRLLGVSKVSVSR